MTQPANQSPLSKPAESASNAEVRQLSLRRPWRAAGDVATCYGIILLGFAMLAAFDAWWVAVLSFVLIGNRQYALSVLAHDGKHGNLLPNRRLNDLFTIWALCAPIGADFRGEKARHRAHHRWLSQPADPDRPLYVVGNKATRLSFLLFVSGLATFPRALTNAARAGTRQSPARSVLVNFITYRGATLVMQAMIWTAIATWFAWWYYFAFWLAPIYALMFVPGKIRMFCEHANPVLPDGAGDAQRLLTYLPNRLERALFAPMNIHLHAEHHLWPFVPYSNLPKLHRLVAGRDDVRVRRSYLGFLWAYFRILPLQQPEHAVLASAASSSH